MPKLIILQGNTETLGGTLVTLSLLIQGFEQLGLQDSLWVPVRAGSLMERYLKERGHSPYLKSMEAHNLREFVAVSLRWVHELPHDWPLLLDNCVFREVIPVLASHAPALRLSQRPVFHFCHDLAVSDHTLGKLSRQFTFALLAPQVLCNSNFTAQHVKFLMPRLKGILYQPVDTQEFAPWQPRVIPDPLRSILASRTKIILMPTRLNQPGSANDKNIRALIPALALLKSWGHAYHGVIIGPDASAGKKRTQTLLAQAAEAGVAEQFTVLPATFDIRDYYAYSDVVVSLAPREPFGRTVIEALACGVPVVGSYTGGVGEILSQAVPQWQVDPADPLDVAQKILALTQDSQTPLLLAQGRQWVERWCSVEGYARRIAEFTLNP